MRKLSLIASLLWLPLFAEEESLEKQVSLLECKMKSARTETVYDCRAGARFANGRPVYCGWGVWATGDVLYWKAFQGGTDYAYTSNTPASQWMLGTIHKANYEWEAGYRLGLSYSWPYDNWDLAALYTSIDPTAEGSAKAPIQGNLGMLFNAPDLATALNGSTKWKTNYSTFDFELGRSFFVSKYLYLRPHFGLRSAWIHQKAKANFSFLGGTEQVRNRNDFDGAGLRLGGDGKWFLDSHWNFNLATSASMLYGKFKVKNFRKVYTGVRPTYQLKETGDCYKTVPAAQMALGFGWETIFAEERCHIALNVAYELNYWWRQNQMMNFETSQTNPYGTRYSDDLGFHGVTGDIQLSF